MSNKKEIDELVDGVAFCEFRDGIDGHPLENNRKYKAMVKMLYELDEKVEKQRKHITWLESGTNRFD